jgi:hypothetical protein
LGTPDLYNNRVHPTKNEPQLQRISNLERERDGGEIKGRAGSQHTGIFKVRISLGEIEGRDREIER